MSKREVDKLIRNAYEVIDKVGIALDGKINSTYCGYISTFGAAIARGGLLSAVAFFQQKAERTEQEDSTKADRTKISEALIKLLSEDGKYKSLADYVMDWKGSKILLKERVLSAAVALKLAMCLYVIEKEKDSNG